MSPSILQRVGIGEDWFRFLIPKRFPRIHLHCALSISTSVSIPVSFPISWCRWLQTAAPSCTVAGAPASCSVWLIVWFTDQSMLSFVLFGWAFPFITLGTGEQSTPSCHYRQPLPHAFADTGRKISLGRGLAPSK